MNIYIIVSIINDDWPMIMSVAYHMRHVELEGYRTNENDSLFSLFSFS